MQEAFDPQKEYYGVAWEYYRCCLLRTLLCTTARRPTRTAGSCSRTSRPRIPEISADGLTWTFTLKSGLHYAPPLEEVEITAQDFVRAMERTADPRGQRRWLLLLLLGDRRLRRVRRRRGR